MEIAYQYNILSAIFNKSSDLITICYTTFWCKVILVCFYQQEGRIITITQWQCHRGMEALSPLNIFLPPSLPQINLKYVEISPNLIISAQKIANFCTLHSHFFAFFPLKFFLTPLPPPLKLDAGTATAITIKWPWSWLIRVSLNCPSWTSCSIPTFEIRKIWLIFWQWNNLICDAIWENLPATWWKFKILSF